MERIFLLAAGLASHANWAWLTGSRCSLLRPIPLWWLVFQRNRAAPAHGGSVPDAALSPCNVAGRPYPRFASHYDDPCFPIFTTYRERAQVVLSDAGVRPCLHVRGGGMPLLVVNAWLVLFQLYISFIEVFK
jgi:hypothetical protein